VAVTAAVAMPVIVGGFGLGAEVGWWYFNQRKVQSAADMAAYAGAVALRSGKSSSEILEAAGEAADKSGFVADRGELTASAPPTEGAYTGDARAVEATVEEALPRMFTALFADGPVQVAGRAVARITDGQQTCILALDQQASGAVTFIGSTSAILIGCNVHSNSLADDSVIVAGSATVQTPCLSAAGMVSVTDGLSLDDCVAPYEHADQAADPYADLAVPDTALPETTPNVFGGGAGSTYNITPGRYRGMDIRRNVNMAPGVYVIDGGTLKVNSTATVRGTGVTFFLTNGATLDMEGGADVTLSAPTSGAYSGVLAYVDRSSPYNVHKVNGNSSSTVNGAIYAASGKVQMNGTSTFGGGCTQIVALQIEFSGNAGIGVDCTGAGVRDIRSSRLVLLVE
jgi:hypothetical protein